MTPAYEDSRVTLYCADALTALRELPDGLAQTCITSPPYWGLRDYGTATWEGGEAGCSHRVPATGSTMNKGNNNREGAPFRDVCGVCGARRIDAQLGLESTVKSYVAKMVWVFREVRRVLRDDGTLWLNLGDSYAGSSMSGGVGNGTLAGTQQGARKGGDIRFLGARILDGLKPKDLCGIPWRVAFALQADGWYLRSDIIWAKPNPMPESVTDRPTKAHEYLFLLAKSERYYYDAEAIKEPVSLTTHAWYAPATGRKTLSQEGQFQVKPSVFAGYQPTERNRRSVWTVATEPYPEAHFATFPPDLIKPCVLAGAAPGAVVLDPFAGAGTTLYVAKEYGRRAVGIELNQAYIGLAAGRLRQEVLL